MDVSTVDSLFIDNGFARDAGVTAGSVKGQYAGPCGAREQVHATARVISLEIEDWRSKPVANAEIRDVYAYTSVPRHMTKTVGGQLATDFMAPNEAVIDFGSQTLFLHVWEKRRDPAGLGRL